MSEPSPTNDMGHPSLPKSRVWSRVIRIVVAILVFIPLAGLLGPLLLVSKKSGKRSEAVSNAKQIGLALFEFREKYGRFPDATTIPLVKQDAKDPGIRLGTNTSNEFFRQLFAAGVIDLEGPFYAQTRTTHRPDNRIKGSMLLEEGEVAFAYVVSHSSCTEDDVPILIAPLVKGTLLSDPKIFDRKVVVFHTNNSVTIESVREDGRIQGPNRMDFFDPSQPYWHGIPPKVAWPE